MRELRITIFNQSKGMSVGFTLTRKQMSKIKTTQSNEVQLNAPRQSSSGVTDSTNGAAKQLPIAPSEDDLLYVSDHCTATKAFRLQWEAEGKKFI
jgi:hypothetical protein